MNSCYRLPGLLLFILIVFQPAQLFSQGPGRGQGLSGETVRPAIGVLRGKLLDERSGLPIEYGTIAILKARDTSMAGGTITDSKGNFRIEKIEVGKYIVRIQFMGFETKELTNIMIKPSDSDVNLGTIKLKQTAASLQGVEITADREMLVTNLDKKVINVDKNIASIGGSAVDVMENVPSVTVDAEGNVSLRGNSNVTILVDGKPTGLSEISSGDLLQQIPASSIESVEVITNPSVRYDPEGTSGIINIVLKKRSLQGLNGMASFTAGTGDRYNTSLNLNYRKDRINLFAGYDNRIGRFNSTGLSERNTVDNEINSLLLQNQSMRNNRNMHNLNTGLDFMLDNYNTLSFSFQMRDMSFTNKGSNRSYSFITTGEDQVTDTVRNFNRYSESSREIDSYNYTLSYKRTFSTKGKELTADFMVIDNAMAGLQDIIQNEYSAGAVTGDTAMQLSTSQNTNRMYTAQLNFITPVGNGGRLETGFKSTVKDITMRNNLSDYSYLLMKWIENESAVNNFDYFEQIHAVYGIYSATYDKLKYQAGLRVEQLISESEIINENDRFSYSYPSLFPSVHLVYELSGTQQLALSYSRRVRRPHNRHLNPYVDYSDSLNIRYGNPRLKPEFINSYELGWSNYWGKNSLNASLFYRQTVGVITNITQLEGNGVTSTTYENLKNERSYGLELIGNREFTKWMKTNLNVSFFKSEYDGSEDFGIDWAESFQWMAKLNMNFALRKDLNLSFAGNYNSPRTMAQGKMDAMYFADMALRYDFLKNSASVSLRVSDIFDTRRFIGETWGPGFVITSDRKMDSRVVYLGFSYRLNNYNRQRDRDRNNQNSDEMDGEDF